MNNMNEMMNKMMEQMMPKMMEMMMASMMQSMMNSMTATVAPAEAVEVPAKQEKMTLEELLALDTSNEVAEKPSYNTKGVVEFDVVDFVPRGGRKSRKGLKYNQYISKSVWTYNHINIKKKYPNVKYSNGCYYCETLGELQQFANPNTGYHIVTNLTDEQKAEVKAYWESRKSK